LTERIGFKFDKSVVIVELFRFSFGVLDQNSSFAVGQWENSLGHFSVVLRKIKVYT
jgi:hypothetical protein